MDITKEIKQAAYNILNNVDDCRIKNIGLCGNMKVVLANVYYQLRFFSGMSTFIRDYISKYFPECLSDDDIYVIRASENNRSAESALRAYYRHKNQWGDQYPAEVRKAVLNHMITNSNFIVTLSINPEGETELRAELD